MSTPAIRIDPLVTRLACDFAASRERTTFLAPGTATRPESLSDSEALSRRRLDVTAIQQMAPAGFYDR
jgi:hypothetical protein